MGASPLLILIGTAVVNTFLLMHEAQDDEATLDDAWRVAGATLLTVALAAAPMYFTQAWLLHFALHDMEVFVHAILIAGVALALTYFARQRLPRLQRSLRSAPLLIVSNGIAIGTVFRSFSNDIGAMTFILRAIALTAGFGVLLAALVCLCNRISDSNVPIIFRGAPIVFITAGLLALALLGFAGLL